MLSLPNYSFRDFPRPTPETAYGESMYTIETNKPGAQETAQWVRVSTALVENQVPFPTPMSDGSQLPETPAPESGHTLLGLCGYLHSHEHKSPTHINIIDF